MKAKSTLIIACLALAFFMTVGTTAAQAESAESCCSCWVGLIVGAPVYIGGAALFITGAIVTAPFSLIGCSNCNLFCNPGLGCLIPKCNY
jgi:NO-binding membrane sensor protein with MHYT domain